MSCLQINPSCHKKKRHKVPGLRFWVEKAHPGLWWHWCSDVNWKKRVVYNYKYTKYRNYVDLVQHHLIFQGKLGLIWVFQWSKRLLWFLWDQNCFRQCDAWFACKMAPHSSIHEKINSKNTQAVPCLKILKGSVLNPLMSGSWRSRARHVMSCHGMSWHTNVAENQLHYEYLSSSTTPFCFVQPVSSFKTKTAGHFWGAMLVWDSFEMK